MKLLISTLALSFALVGCSNDNYVSSPPPKPVYEKVEILEVDPPKHFRLQYKVLSTGATYRVSSKRCSTWNNAEVGKTYVADITQSGCYFTKSLSPSD